MAEITAVGTALMLAAGGVGIAGIALELIRRVVSWALRSPSPGYEMWNGEESSPQS